MGNFSGGHFLYAMVIIGPIACLGGNVCTLTQSHHCAHQASSVREGRGPSMHSRQAALAWQWMGLQAGLATRHLGRTQISLTCRHFAASSYCCTLVQPSVLICTWARMVVLLSFSWFRVKSTDLLSEESTGTKGTHRSKINVPGEAFAESACDHMQQKLQFK